MANETLTFRPSKKNETILAQLAELAEQENRSLNNYIETLFINHLKDRIVTGKQIGRAHV